MRIGQKGINAINLVRLRLATAKSITVLRSPTMGANYEVITPHQARTWLEEIRRDLSTLPYGPHHLLVKIFGPATALLIAQGGECEIDPNHLPPPAIVAAQNANPGPAGGHHVGAHAHLPL